MNDLELLDKFIDMYKSRMADGLAYYKKHNQRCVLLGEIGEKVVPDIQMNIHTKDNFNFDLGNPTVNVMLQQYNTYDPVRECVIGIKKEDGSVFTHVVRVEKK